MRILDENRLGFADFRGNRQYITTGNLQGDDRVSIFLIDYPNKRRLKILGRAKAVDLDDEAMLSRLEVPGYRARVERGIIIFVEAYDWNCPQHITERYTREQVMVMTSALAARVEALEAELANHGRRGER